MKQAWHASRQCCASRFAKGRAGAPAVFCVFSPGSLGIIFDRTLTTSPVSTLGNRVTLDPSATPCWRMFPSCSCLQQSRFIGARPGALALTCPGRAGISDPWALWASWRRASWGSRPCSPAPRSGRSRPPWSGLCGWRCVYVGHTPG